MAVFNNILAGASGATGAAAFQIDRSLRFNGGDTAYLSRTPSSAGNRKTWTWSGWVKRSKLNNQARLFNADTDNSNRVELMLHNETENYLRLELLGSSNSDLVTTQVFRDTSAWYHIVVAVDTTQSTNSDRVKIYVNGAQVTSFSTETYPNQNAEYAVNATSIHSIGRSFRYSRHFDGYMAEINFVDGQQLAATDFGEYDDNNVWQPKAFTGTYPDTLSTEMTSISSGNIFPANGTSTLNALDGSTSTALDCRRGTHASTTSIRFTPSTAITGVTKIRVWAPFANKYQINGGGYQTFTGTSGWSEIYNSSSISLTTLDVIRDSGNAGSDYGHQLHAIEINDVILTRDGSNNSFHLDFSDNSSDAALGTDSSGNNNTWTVNNLSVASGAGNDSLIDTPTNYTADSGNNGGNYATLNPLHNTQTLSNGNLDVVGASSWQRSVSTIAMSSGKWYWEYEITASNEHIIGVGPLDMQMSGNLGAGSPPGSGYGTELGQVNGTGANGSWTNTGGSSTGDVIGIAFDADAGNMYVYKNGSSLNSGIPSHTGLTDGPYYAVFSLNGSSRSGSVNFGQRPFKYNNAGTDRPAATYLSLCTQNLPDPTIADGSTAFDAVTYTGTGSSQSITTSFSPDLVWIKSRSVATGHSLFDTIRGALKRLQSDSTAAEATANGTLTSFDTDGFTLGAGTLTNQSSASQVAWAWDGGTSTVSNTDGSITSSVRANASAGFSIVSYTGNGTVGATVGHGLGANVALYFVKNRTTANSWGVLGHALNDAFGGSQKYLNLDTTGAAGVASQGPGNSSTIELYNDASNNTNGDDFVAYCFTPVEGYSAFGSYESNGLADGPFVYTGFAPKFLLVKSVDSNYDWFIYDFTRDTANVLGKDLRANSSAVEADSDRIDFLSNGFKLRTTSAANNSPANYTWIWAAFAENPFKTARAR